MLGRVPENIEANRPMRFGVIAEYEITENFLRELVRQVTGRMLLFRPKLMITIPYGVTSVERRAVYEAGLGAGSRDINLIQQPLASASWGGFAHWHPNREYDHLLRRRHDPGGCPCHAWNRISRNNAGWLKMDDAIADYVRKKYGLLIGQPTAEQLKINIGAAIPQSEQKQWRSRDKTRSQDCPGQPH